MNTHAVQNPPQAGSISALYWRWVELNDALAAHNSAHVKNNDDIVELHANMNRQIDEQNRIVAYLCEMPARTTNEVLMKLSIWRHSHGDTNPQEDFADQSEYIAYCAYSDLLALTDNRDVATKSDKQFLDL